MSNAVRLMFEYRDGAYRPLAPQHVDMVTPHLPATRGGGPMVGRFVELRSKDDQPVRTVRVGEAGPPSVEFPTGDSHRPFGRVEPPPGAVLSVVIEAHAEATHAALVDVEPSGTRDVVGTIRRDLAVVALNGDQP